MLALGLVIGIISSGTGLGGGFLVVPFLIYLGKEVNIAVGTSILFVFLVAISSLTAHYRWGNLDLKTGLILAGGGVLGAQLGPLILANVPDLVFKRTFAILIISAGIWLFVQPRA